MAELLHPDVYTTERPGQPTIVGGSTSTIGFLGAARRGSVIDLGFVTSYTEFTRFYGKNYADMNLEDANYMAFQNGARRIYNGRVVGAGSAAADNTAASMDGEASAPAIDSGNSEPFDIEPAGTIVVSVDGGGAQTFTFSATRGSKTGAGAPGGTPSNGTTLVIAVDGGSNQTVTFAGTESSAALIIAAINNQLLGGRATLSGAAVKIESDTRGTGSSINISAGSTALAAVNIASGSSSGTGNVVNIDAVTAAEAVTVMSGLTDATASDEDGVIRITHDTPGLTSTLEVTSAHAGFNFPAGEVAGTEDSPVAMLAVAARDVGSAGDDISFTTERWRTTLAGDLASGTVSEAVLTSVARVELGNILHISDGTTIMIVVVNAINVATKTVGFCDYTLGADIDTGATVTCASSHRTKTETTEDAAAADTVIKVANPGSIRVGTELSIDNGTVVIFRVVTGVNGKNLTLNAALGADKDTGALVVCQSFDMTIYDAGVFQKTHPFVSLQSTDTQDYVEVRLNGDTNESVLVEVTDLEPSVSTPIKDHLLAQVNVQLTGGDDGATPNDADYIAALELFNTLMQGDVNIIAVPGIGTVAVQQALSDFAELSTNSVGQRVVALIEAPLSVDEAVEIRDWRLNIHNRDTSYSALYFPWLEITDRNAPVNAVKQVAPSGAVAGLYARVDNEVGVWEAPANRVLLGVRAVVTQVTDGAWDTLNPIGVNLIRAFQGEGVRVMGARTLTNTFDGKHYVPIRRLLNHCKVSISKSLRQYIFAGIQPETFASIERALTSFFRTIWRAGGLYPSDNFERAQFVKCDEENNPQETRTQGILNIDAGINPPYPAEFIQFSLGLYDGGVTEL